MLILLFYLGLLLNFIAIPVDTDFGWHLRCGQQFLETGKMCLNNNFSYFMPDYIWGYSSLLYDINIAWLYSHFGFWGVAFFGALVLFAVSLIFKLSYPKSKTLITSVSIWFFPSLFIINIGYRAQILTLLTLGLLILISKQILAATTIKKQLILNSIAILLITIWVNSHPSFVLGLLIYLTVCALQVWQKKYYYFMFALFALIFSMLNPMGISTYIEVLNHYTVDLSKLIAEWVRPSRLVQIFVLLISFSLLYKTFKAERKKTIWLFFTFCLIISTYLALTAKRHLPIYLLVLVYYLEEFSVLQTLFSRYGFKIKLINISVAIITLFIGLVNLRNLVNTNSIESAYCTKAFVKLPCAQVSKIKATNTHIFTSYEWGGYLIWKQPQNKVFVDGRMPAWKTSDNKSPYTVYLEIIQARKGWQKTLDKYKTDFIFIPTGTFLDILLKKGHPQYQLLFSDDLASLYKRVN